MTHGSKSKRQHGSIGQCATPSRVLPGLKMAGQMGNKRTKVKKLKVRQVGCPECK
jgi:large subunit ribosomal protein L3